MAVAYAVANGNWSSTATWGGGVLPGDGDTIVANGFTVTVNQAVSLSMVSVNAGSFVTGQWYQITNVGTTTFTSIGASANAVGVIFQATGAGSGTGTADARPTITTAAAGGRAAGGGFTMSTVQTFTPDIRAGTTTCLTLSATSGTLSLTGDIISGGNANNAYGINLSSTATLDCTTCIFPNNNTSFCHAVHVAGAGTANFTSCTFTSGGTTNQVNSVYFAGAGFSTVTGCTLQNIGTGNQSSSTFYSVGASTITVVNSTLSASNGAGTAGAIYNFSTGSVSISGSTLSGAAGVSTGFSACVVNNSTGALTITTSTLTAGIGGPCVWSQQLLATVKISGVLIGSVNGYAAVNCPRWTVDTTPASTSYISQSLNGSSTMFTWYPATYSGFSNAAPADVRSGVSYASGALTGTCAVPAAGSVALGVPVDATTGTAVLTADAVKGAVASQILALL